MVLSARLWVALPVLLAGCSVLLPLDGVGQNGTEDAAMLEGTPGPEGGSGEGTGLPDQGNPEGPVSIDGTQVGDVASVDTTVDCLAPCTGAWCAIPPKSAKALRDLAGLDHSSLWAVGDGGTVLHLDLSVCPFGVTQVASSTTNDLYSVTVTALGEVHVGGANGTLLRRPVGSVSFAFNSSALITSNVLALTSSGSTVYAAAGQGVFEHTSAWKSVQGLGAAVLALGTDGATLYAGGQGLLMHRDVFGTVKSFVDTCTTSLPTTVVINGIWSQGGAALAVGADVGLNPVKGLDVAVPGCGLTGTPKIAWNDVAGYSDSALWRVGSAGHVASPTPTDLVATPTADDLYAAWVNPSQSPPLLVVAGASGQLWVRVLP